MFASELPEDLDCTILQGPARLVLASCVAWLDCFGKKIELKPTKRGHFIKIHSAGAYGEVMTSGYNLREQNGVVFV